MLFLVKASAGSELLYSWNAATHEFTNEEGRLVCYHYTLEDVLEWFQYRSVKLVEMIPA